MLPTDSDPVVFWNAFVIPATNFYREHHLERHLAIHAIAQIDIMAEVVANHLGLKAGAYRDDLCARYPILAVIRDAHDTHKHGLLNRKNALYVSKGQRPERETGHGFFAGMRVGAPRKAYEYLGLRTNDGKLNNVDTLLVSAMIAWNEELKRVSEDLRPDTLPASRR